MSQREDLVSGSVRGGPSAHWYGWFWKKVLQVLIRRHLSLFLAVILAILVVGREFKELVATVFALTLGEWSTMACLLIAVVALLRAIWIKVMHPEVRKRYYLALTVSALAGSYFVWVQGADMWRAMKTVAFLDWLILTITGLTIWAAILEFRGRKLSTSVQEVRFSEGIRLLLTRLDEFCFTDSGQKRSHSSVSKEFLDIASNTLCGDTEVKACMMALTGGGLTIGEVSTGAGYKVDPSVDFNDGAAGLAIRDGSLVYVPEAGWKEAWSIEQVEGEGFQVASSPVKAWIQTSSGEKFKTVLCVPLTTYTTAGKLKSFAVMNFTTVKRDLFLTRDFIMADCFAKLLAQALSFVERMEGARAEITRLQGEATELEGLKKQLDHCESELWRITVQRAE